MLQIVREDERCYKQAVDWLWPALSVIAWLLCLHVTSCLIYITIQCS